MAGRDEVKPLKDFQELVDLVIDENLPKAITRSPAKRGCKFSIQRNGSEIKLGKVPDKQ